MFQFFLEEAGFVVPRTISGIAYIQASKPIMLAKFMTSDVDAESGEPTMSIIHPTEQYLSDYDFNVSTCRVLAGTCRVLVSLLNTLGWENSLSSSSVILCIWQYRKCCTRTINARSMIEIA